MTDYTPIDCNLHSEYELAIIQGQHLRISWRDQNRQHHIEVLKPCDLLTELEQARPLSVVMAERLRELRDRARNRTVSANQSGSRTPHCAIYLSALWAASPDH